MKVNKLYRNLDTLSFEHGEYKVIIHTHRHNIVAVVTKGERCLMDEMMTPGQFISLLMLQTSRPLLRIHQ